jgi:hypothetical protein
MVREVPDNLPTAVSTAMSQRRKSLMNKLVFSVVGRGRGITGFARHESRGVLRA